MTNGRGVIEKEAIDRHHSNGRGVVEKEVMDRDHSISTHWPEQQGHFRRRAGEEQRGSSTVRERQQP